MTAARLLGILAAAWLCSGVPAPLLAQESDPPAPAEPAPTEPVPDDTAAASPTRGTRLTGMAYLGRNRGVIGATVKVIEETDPSILYLTATDAKGQFRVGELANGSYRVEVRRAGLVPVVKTGVELRFPFRAVVEAPMRPVDGAAAPADPAADAGDIVLSPGTTALHGTAFDGSGSPLGNVRLRLLREDGGEDPREVMTATDGTFAIEELTTGRWRLEGRGVGYLPLRGSLVVGQTADLRLWLVRQPAGYDPSPLDLMPDELPLPPEGLGGRLLSR